MRTQIVKGKITKITQGVHDLFAKEDIVYNSLSNITEVGESKGISFNDPEGPQAQGKNAAVLSAYFACEKDKKYVRTNTGGLGEELFVVVQIIGLVGKEIEINILDKNGILTDGKYGKLFLWILKDKQRPTSR